jgi:hypothetical protein
MTNRSMAAALAIIASSTAAGALTLSEEPKPSQQEAPTPTTIAVAKQTATTQGVTGANGVKASLSPTPCSPKRRPCRPPVGPMRKQK